MRKDAVTKTSWGEVRWRTTMGEVFIDTPAGLTRVGNAAHMAWFKARKRKDGELDMRDRHAKQFDAYRKNLIVEAERGLT